MLGERKASRKGKITKVRTEVHMYCTGNCCEGRRLALAKKKVKGLLF